MSKIDVPVIPSNIFPIIPYIPFRGKRQSIPLRPIQQLITSFDLNQAIKLEVSVSSTPLFILPQHLSVTFSMLEGIIRVLDQEVIIESRLGEFELELEQEIIPSYAISLDLALEQDIITEIEMVLDFALEEMLELSKAVGTSLDLVLEQDIILHEIEGSIEIEFTLDQEIELTSTVTPALEFTLDQEIELTSVVTPALEFTLDQEIELTSTVAPPLEFTLDQEIILELNAHSPTIGPELYAIVEETGKYRITIDGLYAITE